MILHDSRIEYHKPVLVDQVLNALNVSGSLSIVDATAGDGGHVKAFLQNMPQDGIVVAIDRDKDAIQRAKQRLQDFQDKCRFVCANYSEIDRVLYDLEIPQVDGVLGDLGVSRLQISNPEKGFMYMTDGPLSMKMTLDSGPDASDVVNNYTQEEIADIIYKFGEERDSRKIARAIVKNREQKKIKTTGDLVAVVKKVVSGKYEIKTLARVFQALRIYVNNELEHLTRFLPNAVAVLKPGGRLAVISYHSLEDRIVKNFIREQANPCICPKDLPVCVCGKKPVLRAVGKLIVPEKNEIADNSSARSARMRVAEKI